MRTALRTIVLAIRSFDPRTALFGNNEVGVWYDVSDMSTMFEDVAGTVPAVVDGPVGRINDKSGNGKNATQATAASRPTLKLIDGKYSLLFDGIDDSLSTASIDFSAGDKMTVVAGVRKLSDSVYPVICETYKNLSSVYDSFTLHGSVSAAATGYAASIGTAIGKYWSASTPNATAPISSVISLALNSKGAAVADALKTRLNGVQQSLTDASVGPNTTTNNFGSNPLFIGRREGTSLPFNGHLYGLVVRGAQSTDAQIVAAETWVNSKTGAY